MATRIYNLAKELDLDSKQLVDLCAQAGLTGKGSALAGLDDDEVETVKSFLAGGRRSAVQPAVASANATRPAPPPVGAPLRREDYIGPGGTSGKPKMLDIEAPKEPSDGSGKKPDTDKPKPEKSGPTPHLAPMPAAVTPPANVTDEPKTQKPDLKLPADAIRAGKQGSKPLSEHLRKHEERKRVQAGKPRGTEKAAPAAGGTGTTIPAKDRARRGGRPAPVGKEKEGGDELSRMAGGREARQLKRKRTATRTRRRGEEDDSSGGRSSRMRHRTRRTGTNTAAPRKTAVTLTLPCSVRSFSEAVGVPAKEILRKLIPVMGLSVNLTTTLDEETAELIASEIGVDVGFKASFDLELQVVAEAQAEDEDPALLRERPPIVTFLGHVDHGKTSLLDKIINIDVVSGESGGITQHIRAYRVNKNGRSITFVDTPGHEAFTEMRARGANVTDIAVLVVAAEDGVMPQTEEAISHARVADVPIVVALNKIDLPGANVERVLTQLAENDLLPAEWGGNTEVVKTSALTGDGIEQLLETLLTIAELHEYRANPDRQAFGTCLEAQLQEGRGVVAKFLVQKGTLRPGDVIVCGSAYGRVRAMHDTLTPSVTYDEAGPSFPVDLTGLSEAPGAGDRFYVVDDIIKAREIAHKRAAETRQATLTGASRHVTLENLYDHLSEGEVKKLNLILRADVRGSIEAILKEFTKLEHPEVQIKILQATVGGVTEADVHLADAADAVIIGFNVVPDEGARSLAEEKGVQVRRYEVIYKVTEDIKAALEGMLEPERREKELGRVLVKRTFTISRVGTIAGCHVLSGKVERNARARIIRDSTIIGDYPIDTLRRDKDDVREVANGYECGIKLSGFNDVKESDVFEVYAIEKVSRTF